MIIIQRYIVFILLLYSTFFASSLYAIEIQRKKIRIEIPEQCYNGDPFFLAIHGDDIQQATLSWLGKKLPLVPNLNDQATSSYEAILAVPLTFKDQKIPISFIIETSEEKDRFSTIINVVTKKYPIQRLTVNQKYVTPPKEVEKRIQEERTLMRNTLKKYSLHKYWSYPFHRPVPGEITSLFGLRRVFNGQERSPHKGLDFDAKEGDPIELCESGIIALVGEFYYSGNTVVVDHGLGIFTYYLHLSAIDVTQNQRVNRGEVIGKIGSTGRVTGPHLHLGLAVLGQSVNAAPIIEGLQE